MRGPIAWVRRIREALDVLEEGERMDAEAEKRRLRLYVERQKKAARIIPRAKGGTNDVRNLQTLCWACNRGKGASDPHPSEVGQGAA